MAQWTRSAWTRGFYTVSLLSTIPFSLGLLAGTWGLKLAVPSKASWWLHYKKVVFPLVDK